MVTLEAPITSVPLHMYYVVGNKPDVMFSTVKMAEAIGQHGPGEIIARKPCFFQ